MKFELPKELDKPEVKLVLMGAAINIAINVLYDTWTQFRSFFS